jgi:hypothetical protein
VVKIEEAEFVYFPGSTLSKGTFRNRSTADVYIEDRLNVSNKPWFPIPSAADRLLYPHAIGGEAEVPPVLTRHIPYPF